MENRIKECQLDLFAGRTSAATMRANQLRLWFASMAYVLLCALRRIGLAHTEFAEATCGTLRLTLLKIGALVPAASAASASPWPRAAPTPPSSASLTPDCAADPQPPRPVPQRHQPTPTPIAPRRSAQPCPIAPPPPRGSMIPIRRDLHEGPGEKCGLDQRRVAPGADPGVRVRPDVG